MLRFVDGEAQRFPDAVYQGRGAGRTVLLFPHRIVATYRFAMGRPDGLLGSLRPIGAHDPEQVVEALFLPARAVVASNHHRVPKVECKRADGHGVSMRG